MQFEQLEDTEVLGLLPLQAEVLESIAISSPLVQVLDQLCDLSEKIVSDCVASVMMYNDDRTYLEVVSAPHLPSEAVDALNGTVPGTGAGSCANAVLHGKPTFVCDVAVDDRWCDVRHIAKKFNIGACWSFPIFIHGQVTGSFAITSFNKREPSSLHQQLLKTSAHLAGIAIERSKNDEIMRHSDTAFNNTSEAILVSDINCAVFKSNKAYHTMSGFDRTDTQMVDIFELLIYEPFLMKTIKNQLAKNGVWRGEIEARKKTNETFPALLNICAVNDAEGKAYQYVAVLSDISVLKASERRLSYLAHHDTLTELPNRFAFEKILEDSIENECSQNSPLAILFIDLDNFKTINDARGHAAGDKLLKQVGNRLNDCVRDSDVVARLGGDEYTILLPYKDVDVVNITAQRILSKLSEIYLVDGSEYFSSASIGIALAPTDGDDVESLIKHADSAMYQAKKLGKNQFCFYTRDLTEILKTRMEMEVCLRQAVSRNELYIEYQPQYDKERKIIGIEALLRWNSPKFGLVPPDRFIHIAEESGLIIDIGNWVLENACIQANKFIHSYPDLTLSVNVSRYQLQHFFIDSLSSILNRTGFNVSKLVLEITESTMLKEINRNKELLLEVNEMGVMLSIDDFGTGYSSLSDLKNLPAQLLKIDKSLIDGLPDDDAITKAVLAMGGALGLKVIAEGVETEEQLDTLINAGCDCFQGYLLGKPQPIDKIIQTLKSSYNN